MPESTLAHSIPYPSPSDPVRGSTADYLQTDLRDLALGADAAITAAVGTRAPLSHTHAVSDVSGLQGALDDALAPAITPVAEGIYSTTQASPTATGIHESTTLHQHQPGSGITGSDLGDALTAYIDAMEAPQ